MKTGQFWPAKTGSSGQASYIVLAALVGLLAGIIGSLFHLAINAAVLWPNHLRQWLDGPLLVLSAALITMTLTLAAVFMVRRIAPEASGSGVQEIEGAMEGLRVVRWAKILPVKFFGGIIAIGSGLVLGREGPTIHIGASIAAMLSSTIRLSKIERRGLLAAGAAAGLACAFNAPIAGILFVIEETRKQFPYNFFTYMGIIAASLLAVLMTQLIGGMAPDMTLFSPEMPLGLLPAFAALGCVLGLVGVILNTSILHALNFAGWMHERTPYLYPALAGLCIGALFILLPKTVTGGESVVMELVTEKPALLLLLALALIRFATMVGSYSSGVPGGIFAPILALAACLGLAFGTVVESLLPSFGGVTTAFAIAAMGGLFTASVRAPIVGIVLTLELTGAYQLTMPLLATCLVANLVAQWLGGKPIYEQLLERTLQQEKCSIADCADPPAVKYAP
ncbi:H(+)/Cl(-) exchange transporter ClcA [Aquamicrobium segne]|uniref:H(+)/Cl(-) exchange transporter ClcA n=1 Tax=Aquamicrobium segne TaxID=469547 RepID=A0ABW0GUS8_9HYPH